MGRIKTIAAAIIVCIMAQASAFAQDKAPYKAGQKTITEPTKQEASGKHSTKAKKYRHKVKKSANTSSQREVKHNAPDQRKLDSVKAAKTKLKK